MSVDRLRGAPQNVVKTTGGDTIEVVSASTTPLTLKAAAAQTANLLNLQGDDGTSRMRVEADGGTYARHLFVGGPIGGSRIPGADLNVTARVAENKGLVVRGAASQTANLQEWQDSTGAVRSKILPGGGFVNETVEANAFGGPQLGGVILTTHTGAGGNKGIVVRGAAAQTANLLEIQNSTGTVGLKATAYGTDLAGVALEASVLRATNIAGSAGVPVLIVKGTTGQTANLQEWQDSAGTVIASVNSGGSIYGASISFPAGGNSPMETSIRALGYSNGSVNKTSVVSVGAADSGGAGYRVLRVEN